MSGAVEQTLAGAIERLQTLLLVEKAAHAETAKSAAKREHHLQEQRDALALALEDLRAADCWTDTYCEFCQAHAPKKDNGVPCGPIPHFEECARAAAEAALRLAGRLP